MNYTQHTQKWGNGTGILLSKKVLQAASWQDNQTVSIDVKGNSITLTPVPSPADKHQIPRLEDLMKGVTPEKVGGDFDWGPDVGNEIIRD